VVVGHDSSRNGQSLQQSALTPANKTQPMTMRSSLKVLLCNAQESDDFITDVFITDLGFDLNIIIIIIIIIIITTTIKCK